MAALVHHHVHAFAPRQPAVSHHACSFPSRPAPPSPPFVLVRWTPPRPGWWKLNFDGSVYHDGSGRASIGGAIRDCTGRVVLAFAERTEHASVGEVEARALLRGLRLALDNGCAHLVVEGDDLTLVRLLRGESRLTRITRAMEDEIVGVLACCFHSVEVRHVYREGNQVADTLCHEAYKREDVWTADRIVPFPVWEKVENDRFGVAHKRFLRSA